MTFIILFILYLLPLWGSADNIGIKVSVDRPNYFDHVYVTMSKSSAFDHLFGFSEDKACMIRRDREGWLISIQKINSIERSGPTKIETYHDFRYLKPASCFYFKDYSYIIFKNTYTNESSIIRGLHEKILSNFTYEQIKYDHYGKRLYMIRSGMISEIHLDMMERWWLESNQGESVTMNTKEVGTLPANTDFLIIDEHIYYIKDRKIYRYRLGEEDNKKFITDSNADVFNFMIFKEYEPIMESSTKFWVYFLYVFDLVMLIICAFIIKTMKIKRKKGQYPPIVMEALLRESDERVYKG